MDVDLTAEQLLFIDVVSEQAAAVRGRWHRGQSPETTDGCAPSVQEWTRLAEAGWLSLRSDGEGTDVGSCLDVCLLTEQLGYHAVPAPVLGTLLVLEQLRLRGADPQLLKSIAIGDLRVAPVLTPALDRFAAGPTNTSGSAARSFDSAGASVGLLAGEELIGYELIGSKTGADLTRELATIDRARILCRAPLSQPGQESSAALTAFALVLVSADLLGVMRGAFDTALAHAKTREQFGVPIGSFQAIQHIAAECQVSIEATTSAVWYSAWAVDELPPQEALIAARTTKAFAATTAIDVVEACVQIFGGIGMTWESPVHVWQRRAHLDRVLFGDEHHQTRLLGNF
jgi:alkylation response protein AidB-like acyl-CoA dehydrogenase